MFLCPTLRRDFTFHLQTYSDCWDLIPTIIEIQTTQLPKLRVVSTTSQKQENKTGATILGNPLLKRNEARNPATII